MNSESNYFIVKDNNLPFKNSLAKSPAPHPPPLGNSSLPFEQQEMQIGKM